VCATAGNAEMCRLRRRLPVWGSNDLVEYFVVGRKAIAAAAGLPGAIDCPVRQIADLLQWPLARHAGKSKRESLLAMFVSV